MIEYTYKHEQIEDIKKCLPDAIKKAMRVVVWVGYANFFISKKAALQGVETLERWPVEVWKCTNQETGNYTLYIGNQGAR